MTKRIGLALIALGILGAVGCSREDESTPVLGVVEITTTDIANTTVAYLQDHRAELEMRAPAEELSTLRILKDDLAMTHVRFRQVERGVRVIGGGTVVHYDPAGGIKALHKTYVPELEHLDIHPTIDAEKAKTFVPAGEHVVGEPELVIFAFEHRTPKLAWEMTVRTARRKDAWLLTVDAHTGEVVDRITRSHSLQGSGVGVFGKKRNVEYTNSSGTFALIDETRAFTLTTFDAKAGPDPTSANILLGANATSWDTSARLGKGSGVDAHANIGVVVDYYLKKFGRKSWDDKNGDISIVVHVGDDVDGAPGLDNAYYDSALNVMAFGDGRDILKPTAGFLDVTAHEFTHAVTNFTSNMRYEDQSGALNESVSDVFGAMIEHSVAPDSVKNWLVGEGSLLDSPGALRDMTDPGKGVQPQPSHMSEYERTREDGGGVHTNSGIPNKAAQLMTVGGNHGVSGITIAHGIGWDNSERVWYRANTMYLTETSNFADAAEATMHAAKDLDLSQDDQNVIDCAWKAVGVLDGECAKINPATTKPTTSGDDDSVDTSSGRSDEDDRADDSDSTPKKKTKKKSTGSTGTDDQGCSAAPGAPSGNGTWMWLLAAALVIRSRVGRGRAGKR